MRQPKNALTIATLVWGVVGLVCPWFAVWAQTPSGTAGSGKSYEIEVSGTKEWMDTNIDVRGGAKLRFTATGQITYSADTSLTGRLRTSGTFGPRGLPRGFADLVHQYAVADAGHGARHVNISGRQ
jgi:hypothetical protein